VVRELLAEHYDPVYFASMKRNFKQYEQAKLISPNDHSQQAMLRLAQQIAPCKNLDYCTN
jgi:tRNA 2-selenouridine synthase